MKKRLLFFAEGNNTIGRGHISRCLAIANMIDDIVDVHFVCKSENENFVKKHVDPRKILPIERYEDFETIISDKDLVWIDNYDLDSQHKKQISVLAAKVIETNDIPYDNKYVDIIINHTPGISKSNFSTKSNSKYYLGLDYALLRPKFLQNAREDNEEVIGDGIFICFGGADTYDLGLHYVNELRNSNFSSHIYWVTNKSEITLEGSEKLTILQGLSEEEMILYMKKAKVLLIPSSVLSFEAIALRKPIFTTNFVSNQDLIFQGLINLNLASGIKGIHTKEDVQKSIPTLKDFYENSILHQEQKKNQKSNLDGNSELRIEKIVSEVRTQW